MGKDSFVFYVDWLDHLQLLSPEETVAVLKAIRTYVGSGKVLPLSGACSMAFSFIRAQLDRDREKWEDTRGKRSEAGKKGAAVTNSRQKAAKSASAEFAEQDAAKSAVTVPVTVPVYGSASRAAVKPSRVTHGKDMQDMDPNAAF